MLKTDRKAASQAKGTILLLITAFIWGTAFVAQSLGVGEIGFWSFDAARFLIAAVAMAPIVIWRIPRLGSGVVKKTLIAGVPVGLIFFAACSFQNAAFNYTSAGKIGFITAMYMFIVPFLGLFIGKRLSRFKWICVCAGLFGLYLLCAKKNDFASLNKGDMLALACAFCYALHILFVEQLSDDVDGVILSALQFLYCGVLSLPGAFIAETTTLGAIKEAILPILYASILSSCVAYTFQIIGQKYVEATLASMIMCLESVFCVLASALILGERMTGREIAGCAIMFAAIIASQLSGKFRMMQ